MSNYKTEVVTKENAAELDSYVAASPKAHFMQMSNWADVKNNWKWRGVICRDSEGNIAGTIAVLIRKVPALPYTLFYCPRGPVCDLHNKEVFAQLIEALKKLGKQFRCCDIKLDPDVAVDDDEFRAIATAQGFTLMGNTLSFETAQPRFVFRLNVEGKTEEEVMAAFHSKTRYNIRVAIKNNVTVEIKGPEAAEEFHKIMVETGTRDNFGIRSTDYFRRMLVALGDDARIYMAYYNGIAIAGSLALRCGDKVWYLYGASSNEHRNVMPNYVVQWAMIRWSIESGCKIYDFRGVSGFLDESNPLYGIYKFKKGFNGDLVEFMGEMDLIEKPLGFKIVKLAGVSMRKYVRIKGAILKK
jgi:peptidoglycan pentaglycine glycine transferase (the first glycine)